MKAVIALLVLCLAAAVAYIFTRPKADTVPVEVVSTVAESAAVLAQRCQADEGFDPDVTHWSTELEVAPGVRVVIVPHLQSNQHSPGQLARGQVVAKFVNRGDQEYTRLALPANGQSCLFVKWQRGNSGKDQLSARVVAAGNASMEKPFNNFQIDFHAEPHATPLARWYDARGEIIKPPVSAGPTGGAMAFGLANFLMQRDSTGGGGPSAWVTCVTNGCCRVSLLEE